MGGKGEMVQGAGVRIKGEGLRLVAGYMMLETAFRGSCSRPNFSHFFLPALVTAHLKTCRSKDLLTIHVSGRVTPGNRQPPHVAVATWRVLLQGTRCRVKGVKMLDAGRWMLVTGRWSYRHLAINFDLSASSLSSVFAISGAQAPCRMLETAFLARVFPSL